MIRCEDFERYLLDLHAGVISKELAEALEEHRRICQSCRELTPELIQIRQRLLSLVRLEPRTGFEMRLAYRLQEMERPNRGWFRSLEESIAANWLAFGTGAVATVLIGFMLFSPKQIGLKPGGNIAAENDQTPVVQQSTHPELLTSGRESLPFGTVNDSTGQFYLVEDDSIPVNHFPPQDWQGQPVSQQK